LLFHKNAKNLEKPKNTPLKKIIDIIEKTGNESVLNMAHIKESLKNIKRKFQNKNY